MKKIVGMLLAGAVMLSLWGCPQGQESVSEKPSAASRSSAVSRRETSSVSESASVASESSAEPERVLPGGVTKASGNKLRFTTSVLSLSAFFPDEFYVEANDYKPQYGIYLQNDTGTATLLLEAVNDNTMTYREMKEYLQGLYPDAEVRITDKKEVTCQRRMTDKSGKQYLAMQKFHVVRGGYHLAAICCHPSDKALYYPMLLDVDFS